MWNARTGSSGKPMTFALSIAFFSIVNSTATYAQGDGDGLKALVPACVQDALVTCMRNKIGTASGRPEMLISGDGPNKVLYSGVDGAQQQRRLIDHLVANMRGEPL